MRPIEPVPIQIHALPLFLVNLPNQDGVNDSTGKTSTVLKTEIDSEGERGSRLSRALLAKQRPVLMHAHYEIKMLTEKAELQGKKGVDTAILSLLEVQYKIKDFIFACQQSGVVDPFIRKQAKKWGRYLEETVKPLIETTKKKEESFKHIIAVSAAQSFESPSTLQSCMKALHTISFHGTRVSSVLFKDKKERGLKALKKYLVHADQQFKQLDEKSPRDMRAKEIDELLQILENIRCIALDSLNDTHYQSNHDMLWCVYRNASAAQGQLENWDKLNQMDDQEKKETRILINQNETMNLLREKLKTFSDNDLYLLFLAAKARREPVSSITLNVKVIQFIKEYNVYYLGGQHNPVMQVDNPDKNSDKKKFVLKLHAIDDSESQQALSQLPVKDAHKYFPDIYMTLSVPQVPGGGQYRRIEIGEYVPGKLEVKIAEMHRQHELLHQDEYVLEQSVDHFMEICRVVKGLNSHDAYLTDIKPSNIAVSEDDRFIFPDKKGLVKTNCPEAYPAKSFFSISTRAYIPESLQSIRGTDSVNLLITQNYALGLTWFEDVTNDKSHHAPKHPINLDHPILNSTERGKQVKKMILRLLETNPLKFERLETIVKEVEDKFLRAPAIRAEPVRQLGYIAA